MAETEKDGLLEDVLNELDITFKDDRLEKKIAGIYGRSNAIEQFKHDFSSELTALALRGAIQSQKSPESAESEEEQ